MARGSRTAGSSLLLPVLLPATKASEYGLGGEITKAVPWLGLLGGVSLIYRIVGILLNSAVMEG